MTLSLARAASSSGTAGDGYKKTIRGLCVCVCVRLKTSIFFTHRFKEHAAWDSFLACLLLSSILLFLEALGRLAVREHGGRCESRSMNNKVLRFHIV